MRLGEQVGMSVWNEEAMLVDIDIDALREYLLDYCGSAMCSGFPAAVVDLGRISSASGEELCEIAEELGVDLRKFVFS